MSWQLRDQDVKLRSPALCSSMLGLAELVSQDPLSSRSTCNLEFIVT